MAESDPVPEIGAIRHAEDGTLEAFDGQGWARYVTPPDPYSAPVFKGAPAYEEPGDIVNLFPDPVRDDIR
jgi:hypothetical protein